MPKPTPEHIAIRISCSNPDALKEAMEAFRFRMGDAVKWNPNPVPGSKHGDILIYGEFLPHRERRRRAAEAGEDPPKA